VSLSEFDALVARWIGGRDTSCCNPAAAALLDGKGSSESDEMRRWLRPPLLVCIVGKLGTLLVLGIVGLPKVTVSVRDKPALVLPSACACLPSRVRLITLAAKRAAFRSSCHYTMDCSSLVNQPYTEDEHIRTTTIYGDLRKDTLSYRSRSLFIDRLLPCN
jgi:hypothetical protein